MPTVKNAATIPDAIASAGRGVGSTRGTSDQGNEFHLRSLDS